MIKAFLLIFVISLSANILFAQDGKAVEVDDFGLINSEMLESNLDLYSSQLLDNPSASLQILIYRGEEQLVGSSYRLAAVMKNYIAYHRKVGDRVSVNYCASEKQRRVNIWILPAGVSPQTCSPPAPFVFTKTTLFDSFYNFDMAGCCLVDEFSEVKSKASLAAFSQVLKENPGSNAYVYLYKSNWVKGSNKSSFIKKWRKKVIKEITDNGIESSRITVKYGGYRNQSETIEFWVVPKNGEIPKPSND